MAGELITGNLQVEWDGHLITGMVFDGQSALDGWDDLPGITTGDIERPSAHGAFAGRMLAQSRHITWRFRARSTPDDMAVDLPALRAALGLTDDERPLVIRTLGETLMCWARVEQRIIPTDGLYTVGRPTIVVQWVATDPRRYTVGGTLLRLHLPTAMTGAVWPYVWPISWPGVFGFGSGKGNAVNCGDTTSPPMITITGPVDSPSITNTTTGSVLEFDLVLTANDVLTVDVLAGTATLQSGADRTMTVSARSVPVSDFLLVPGDNQLSFRSPTTPGGGAAEAAISWRSAYL